MLCYVRMFVVEQHYQNATGMSHSLAAGNYWERKLSSVQGRYLRSLETLARVRKLLGVPPVQINIASQGGQQVVSNG